MLTGDEKCVDCKQTPFPRGFEPTLQKCWYCVFPRSEIKLTDAQRAVVEASWE